MQTPQAEYEVLFLQLAVLLTLAVEEAQDREVGYGMGGGVEVSMQVQQAVKKANGMLTFITRGNRM